MYNFSDRLVKKILYRENIILIEFNEYMHIEKKEHSYLNKNNYLLKTDRGHFFIPKDVKIELIKKGYIIRMIFPKSYSNKLFIINSIYLGYVCNNKIFYIQSFKEIIQNISNPIRLEKETSILNIEEGIVSVLDDFTLKYVYTGQNKFYYVNLSDFYLKNLNKEYYPTYFVKENNEIIFVFENPVFSTLNTDVTFNVVEDTKSKDMFILNIKGNSILKVNDTRPTYIKSLSFSDYRNGISCFKIYFSAPLRTFFDGDFLIQSKDILYKCFYENTNKEKNIIDVKVTNLGIQNILKDKFKLRLLKKANQKIKTLDYKNDEIILKNPVLSDIFISNNIEWIRENDKLSGSLIKISFQRDINTSSIITNSHFDEELIAWNGEPIEIPSKNLIITNINTVTKIILKYNESFGEILIVCKKGASFINKTTYNEKNCTLYLKNRELSIKFDDDEENKVDFLAVKSIVYNPGKNIRDKNENFIFSGYCPTRYESSLDIVYIEPLKSSEENPFNGGVKNNSFVVKVNNSFKFRDYGILEMKTTINGFLKIIGELNINESIIVKNINVLGNVYLETGKSKIIFNKLECDNLIYS